MATRKVVPRGDNEGGIGTNLKRWASGFFFNLSSAFLTISTFTDSGFLRNDTDGVISGGNAIDPGDLPDGINANKIGTGTVDNTKYGYLSGVTSDIQAQLNALTAALAATQNQVDALQVLVNDHWAKYP